MGFDYSAHQRQQMGVDPDKGLLVSFRYESEEIDGKHQNVPYISIYLGKNDTVDRRATQEDLERFSDRWDSFVKGEEVPPEGMPISSVPFATPANVSSCKAERIYTVEQLISTPDNRLQRAHLVNFKYMCRDMMEAKNDNAYIQEMRKTIEKQGSMIKALEEKLADKPKKRGRPRKKVNGDDS